MSRSECQVHENGGAIGVVSLCPEDGYYNYCMYIILVVVVIIITIHNTS